MGLNAKHLSMPEGDDWWSWKDEMPALFVIMTRRPDIRNISAYKSGHVDDVNQAENEWYIAIQRLSAIPNAYWMSYEAMVANQRQQVQNLADWLNVNPPVAVEEWRDGNLPYRIL
jgi:hypothetical protein